MKKILASAALLVCFSVLNLWVGMAWADLVVNTPGLVLMIDGTDHNSTVETVNIDATLPTARYDFGYVNGALFTPIALAPSGPTSLAGQYNFAGGSLVNFALRDNQTGSIYTISNPADYANEIYSGPIDPSFSLHPHVSSPYYSSLLIQWDLDRNGFNPTQDAGFTLTQAVNVHDGMTPAPVPIPASFLLFCAGLAGLTAMSRQRIFG